ncbi:carnitine O-acetyltransferase isoform X2 [Drosophila grimshawi]|uniref:GH13285 n=1 Tax=Drosophila grimshawi TaxID=7222 RepID=B4JQ29_DROGR|nr:carnitine O-acetyltransferase isoform X2 [Drosophila grimshawi]EDV99009.1 GH13285 [Drosophila grimshawi]
MRAILNANKCNINARKYSKQDAGNQSNVAELSLKTKSKKEIRLVEILTNYLKGCAKSLQLHLPQIQNDKGSDVKTELQPNKTPMAITGDHLTKPDNKANNGAAEKLEKSSSTNRNVQKNLLKFPVVPLDETLDRYLDSVQPFFTEKKFQKEQELTYDFLQSSGLQLQEHLIEASKREYNWLTERWTTATYLRHRAPLTVFSSPCITFPKQHFPNIQQFLDFTAKAIYGMCEFKKLVENGQLPVYTMNGFQLDNSQFHHVFGTVRIPRRSCDILQQFDSNYVIVIHKNNFYKMPVYTAEKRVLDVYQLRKQLAKVIQSGRPAGPQIGLFTHDTRDNWTEAHEMLCRQEINAKTVQCIEKALFTVSLDEPVEVPAGQERSMLAAQLLHGGGIHSNSANRWMDKTLQLIVNPNGMAGICYELAPADPQPAATIMDYVQRHICNPKYGQEFSDPSDYGETSSSEELAELQFAEINDCIDFWLMAAKRSINLISRQLRMSAFQFDCYGRSVIKSHKMPPDSYIQMALQLAFYRRHKELPAQQEAAHLRIFSSGRNEIIRTTSNESLNFVRAMVSKRATHRSRLLALLAAVEYHQELTKMAMRGCGVDRHLFGLKQMARENAEPLPKFFYSDGYQRSTNFRIVSAQLTTSHDAFMANGPLNSEGYGCSYNLREDDIIFAVSAWQRDPHICAELYGYAIESALVEMGELILATNRR